VLNKFRNFFSTFYKIYIIITDWILWKNSRSIGACIWQR